MDDKVKLMFGGSGKGIKEIRALTVPGDGRDEPIALVKELLQYKIDMQITDPFDQEEWQTLVTEHQHSPCMEDLTYRCLMQQTLTLLGIPDSTVRRSYLTTLAETIIEQGDSEFAKVLLDTWPTAEEIRKDEESLPRLRRPSPIEIKNEIFRFRTKYMQLLFLAGLYQEGERLLIDLEREHKTGSDYGAIHALIMRGDLEKAYEISEMTNEWTRQTPDPKRNSSAHHHCYTYTNPKTRPAAMGELALAFLENGDLVKAYKTTGLVKHYWENKAFGQSSTCYLLFAKDSYIFAMVALIDAYAGKNQKDVAGHMFEELSLMLRKETSHVNFSNMGQFELAAKTAAKNGLNGDVTELATFVKDHNEMEYLEIYSRRTNDPVPLLYALAGDYKTAVTHIENHDYSPDSLVNEKADVFHFEKASEDEVRLTTYLQIAEALTDIGDKEGALLFLDKATPYFGSRNPKYDPIIKNFSDYITKAEILLKLDEKEKSREVFEQLLDLFNNTTDQDYRSGSATKSFYGQLAYLYARFDNINKVQAWANRLPTFYSAGYYARIAALLIEEGRREELNAYMEEVARVLSTDEQPIQNWYPLLQGLIKAGDYDRYLSLLDTLDEGTETSKQRQGDVPHILHGENEPKTPDTRQQIQIMNKLLVSKLVDGNIPQGVINTIWPRYITNCREWERMLPRYGSGYKVLPDAKETMAACYVGIIRSVSDFERFKAKG